jgi:hypothetical protein
MKTPREIVKICSSHYNYWKKQAINASDPVDRVKAVEKAFFWLELQSSLLILWTIENSHQNDSEIQRKILLARANLNKKLLDYAEQVLKELR